MAYALRSPLDPTYDPSQDRPDPGPLVMRNYGMGSTEPTPTAMTNYGMGSDRVSPLIPQSTNKAPVIAPVPQTEDQIVAAGGVPPSWEEKYLQPEPPPEKGFVGKIGQALGGGVDTLMGNLKATGNLYMGDYAGVEANAKKAQEQAANRPKEQQAFGQAMAALPDNPGLIEGIKGMAGAIWEQPQGALQEFVAQAPNSAAVMGGMAAGGALGSAILPGIGTAVGAILGGFLGNLGIETGARLMDSGADGLTDAAAKQAMSEGALKAAGVTGVDMATLGATRWLMGAPSRAASKAITGSLAKSGVDVADDAAVSAAMQTIGVGSEALLQGARAMARATGRAPLRTLASAGLETIGEGTGEYLGEVMATGQGSMKEALLESIMAAPMSAGEIVWAKSDANQPFKLGTALERAMGTDLSDPQAVDNYINTNLPHFAALSLDQDQLGIISKDEAMQALGNPNAPPLQRINAVAGIAADIATRQKLTAVSEAWLERAKALMANGEVIKVPGYTQPIPAYQEQQKADRRQERPITPPPETTAAPKAEAGVASGLAPKPIIPNRMEEQQTTGMIPRTSPLEVSAPMGGSANVAPEKQEVTAPIVATAPVPTPERPPFVPTHTASDGVPVRQIQGNEFEDANGDIIVDDYADKLTPQEAQGMRRVSIPDIAKQLQEEQDSINARQQFAKTNDGIPFSAPMRNQPQKTVMVTPSAQQPGKWQITYLDKNGEPSGDSQANSYSEAVDVAHQYGANWDQVALSGQPSKPVVAPAAAPVVTSSIEKPSSGIQQKLAQNREEAKQSPTTPALNRNEGESYRDWAARSWVALQTKPTDGSWDSSVIENTANRIIKPLAQKLDKGGWSTLDNLTPTSRGSRDPRRSISRHLEEMKQQGLVQIAWDNQGNSHWSKSGTSLPNWLTTSTDEQAIAALSPKPANAIQSRLQENRAQQEAQAAPAPWEMTKDEYVATTTPKDPRDASFTKAINRKDVEARGDGIYYVPAKVATPQFLNRLKTQQERASLTGRVTPTNQFEFKPWSEVTGDTTSAEASGYAILDRRARQNERIGNDHRAAVQQALAEGKSIPTSVLKDYPDLTVSQETANEPQAVETQPLAINPKKQTPIFTPDGKRFSAQWDVVEADSLSPTLTTGENQPRDRNRIGSDLQIQTIANNPDFKRLSDIGQTMDVGAPTMTREGVIVGGNGRVAGVTRSYNIGKAQGYRQALIDRADEFGADPAQIAGMSKPVLVRRLQEPVDTRAMALASNKPQGLAMGSTETAKVDAERMRNLSQIEVTDTGDIATNTDNIAKLRDSLSDYDITEQAGFIDGTGNISADGLRRVRNAILHKAYGDSPVITRLLETADPDLKNVGTALVRAGGKMAEMNDVINRGDVPSDYAVATDVSQAIETLSQLRQNKVPLAEHLSQQNLFGEEHSPAEKRILQFLDENGRSAKAITSFLEDYADRVISSQGIGQDLFGTTITPPTKDQVLTDVARSNTRTAPTPSGDLFIPTPAQQVASQPQNAGNNAPGNRVLGGETASGGITEATTTAAVAPANTQAAPIPQAATEAPVASPLDIRQAEKQLAMAKARVSSLANRINRLGPNATNRAALEQRLAVAQGEVQTLQAKADAIRLPDQTAIPEAPAVSTKPPTVADLQYVKLNARDPVTKRIRDEDRGYMAVRYETPDGVINVGEIIDHRAAYGDTTTSQPWETSDGQRHMNLALAKKHELVTQVIPKLQRDGYLAPEAPPAAATARAPAPAVTNTPEVAPVNAAPSTEQQPTPAIAKTKVRTAYDLTDEEYQEIVADARYLKDVAYSIGNLLGNDKKAMLRIGLSKSTRDNILMDALNIDRDLAHTINNGLDDKEVHNLRKQDMEEAMVKFPMLKKLVDEHAPKPSSVEQQGIEFNPATHIKIAADSIEQLRPQDVGRLFDEAPYTAQAWDDLAYYITKNIGNRKEIDDAVTERMQENPPAYPEEASNQLSPSPKKAVAGQVDEEAKSTKATAPNQQAEAVTEAELEDLQLVRKWGDRWQYKFRIGGNWLTANTKQDAVDRATETYQKTPEAERLTSQQRFDKANQDEMDALQRQYGHLSLSQLQQQLLGMQGTIDDLQQAGKREFNGNGGRRTSAAVAAQGARDTAEERSKLGRYIAWRQEQEQSKASLPDREIDSILPSDKPDSQSLLNDVLDEEFGATPVAKPRATRKPRAAKAPPVTKPTVAEAAGSAVKNFSEASTQALKGIAALFDPGKGTLGSGPVFNEDTWAKAKPLFVQAVQGYQASWQDIKEVIRAIVRALRELGLKREGVEAMSPYITRFADEVRDGVIILGGDNVQSTDTDAQGDSGATGDGEQVNQADVEHGTGTPATTVGRDGEQVGGRGVQPVGHRGLSGTGAAVEGEPGGDGVSSAKGRLDDGQRASRPGERDGGGRPGDTGVASGRQRAAATSGVTDAARALAEQTAITPADLDNIRTTLPQLLPSQQEDVQRAEQRFHTQNQLGMLFTNGTGTGKAQPLDAKLMTPFGWTRMGQIKVNDLVIAEDGKPTRVLGVYPQGDKQIFRVKFSDGAQTECCDDHLWETQTLYARRKAKQNPDWQCAQSEVRPLSEIRATLDKQHFVPVASPLELESTDIPIPAYIMGVILGDGCITQNVITFSLPDQEIVERVNRNLPSAMELRMRDDGKRCPQYTIAQREQSPRKANGTWGENIWLRALRDMGLHGANSAKKFVPDDYLRGSIEQRTELLQGMMDTDGWVSKKTNSPYFTSVSRKLADDVAFLARSLGGIATIKSKKTKYLYKGKRLEGQDAYNVCLNLPSGIEPFSLTRKAALYKPNTKYPPRRKIVEVEPVGIKPAQCIAIEHPRHLYVTDDCILTHNTYLGLGIVKRMARQGKTNIIITAPGEKIIDDWINAGKKFGLEIRKLADTKDAGQDGEIVITTYANFGQNDALVKRNWDLVVHDEAHYLMQDKDGTPTASLRKSRALTGHPDGALTYTEAMERDLVQQIADLKKASSFALARERERLIGELREREKVHAANRAELWKRKGTRRLDLSATPFAYETSVKAYEGFLFDFDRSQDNQGGYNRPNAFGAFMVRHFGWRMRTGKLTSPEASVDSGVMQRQFNRWLKQTGALSSRRLSVEQDYSREFIAVESLVGRQIDEGFSYIRERAYDRDNPLSEGYKVMLDYLEDRFPYHERIRLLEAIKAPFAVERARQHLALGRKVVIFHSRIQGGSVHPFKFSSGVEGGVYDRAIRDFKEQHPELANLDLGGLTRPLDLLKNEFGDRVTFYNGTVSSKDKRNNPTKFNYDDGGVDVIVVQDDAGKEGISLHDTTGNKQRVLINIGLPIKPTQAIQIEGRIFRVGQASDAIFEYFNTGTTFERFTFATKISERASVAENMAMGDEARRLRDSFVDAFENPNDNPPSLEQGKGGKAADTAMESAVTPFQEAKTHYFANLKNTKRRDQREGIDYFATPEPLGLKMVEWSGMRPNDAVLEPSAGHGAIARYFPESVRATFVEPSSELMSRLALRTNGKLRQQRFEDMDEAANKFDAIVMNPPYGTGGSTARDHLAKAMNHLNNGGRIVALIPEGPAADAKFGALLYGSDNESVAAMKESLKNATGENATRLRQRIHQLTNFHVRASISLPPVVFERAGTAVKTRVLIIDRLDKGGSRLGDSTREIDATNIKDFFDRIEEMSVYDRPPSPMEASEVLANNGITVSEQDTGFYVMGTKYEQSELLRPIMRKHQGQWNGLSKYWFTTTDPSEDLAKALQGEPVEGLVTEQPAPVTDNPDIISHTTQAGKVIRGVVRTDMNADQAKAIDPYTFRKNGGWFIREAHLSKLAERDAPIFSKTKQPGTSGASPTAVRAAVSRITSKWANAPRMVVFTGMDDTQVDEAVRKEYARQTQERLASDPNAAPDQVDAFYYRGTVYINSESIANAADLDRALRHETLGHAGLRALFGNSLNSILDQVIAGQNAAVVAKAKQRGLNMANTNEARTAAEEVLAELSETRPNLSVVRRAVALIRRLLRDMGVSLSLSNNDIIAEYLIPARNFIERGNPGYFGLSDALAFAIRTNTSQSGLFLSNTNIDYEKYASRSGSDADRELVNARITSSMEKMGVVYPQRFSVMNREGPHFGLNLWKPGDEIVTTKQGINNALSNIRGRSALFGQYAYPIYESEASYLQGEGLRPFFADGGWWFDAVSTINGAYAGYAATKGINQEVGNILRRVDRRTPDVWKVDHAPLPETASEYPVKQTNSDIRFSIPPRQNTTLPSTITIDGIERPTINSEGNPIHPTEEGVRNFWKWFGDSKVVDGQGRPLVVYHGTFGDFSIFDPTGKSDNPPDIGVGHFGSRYQAESRLSTLALKRGRKRTGQYASMVYDTDGANIMSSYLKLENPLMMHDAGQWTGGSIVTSFEIEKLDFISKQDIENLWKIIDDLEDQQEKTDAVKKYLKEVKGFDGIVYGNVVEGNGLSYLPFEKTQVKSSIGNRGTFDGSNPDIRFSLSPRQNTTLDSAWQKLNLAPEKQKTLTEHVQTLLGKNWRQAMTDFKANAYEGLFDGLINIDRAEKEVGITKPEQSGYVSARMATGIADTLWGVLNKGAPEWRNGVLAYKRGTKGLLTVLGDLGPDMRDWLGWMAGNRANELMAQGRENNLEQAEIDELLALATTDKAQKFMEAKAAYNALNSAMLDVAEQAGLIDPQSRSQWESEWYVPFYRQLEIDGDATLLGPRTTRGLSHQTSGIRALKGGSAPTADLLTNILTNWTKLVDASMKNHALSQVADNLNGTRFMVDETTKWKQVLVSKPEMIKRLKESPELVREMADWLGLPNGDIVYTLNEIKRMTRGEMEKLWTKVAPTDKEVIRIQRDGKNYYYRVLDPALLRSIESFGFQGFSDPMTRTARTFKRLLTTGVTSMPDFIIRNFVRDAVHSWAINKDGMKFASDAVKGIRKTYGESDAYWDLVFSGGAFQGGYVHGTDPEASAQIVRRSLGRKGLSPSQIEARERGVLATKDRIIDVLDKYWERYRSWGDKAENVNRLATYEAAIAAGKSPLQAAYEAKDLMDYSLRGNYQMLMRFTDMVPFLNARIQGLGKLGRSGMADPRIVGMKVAKIAAFSVALAILNGDDDRYKKLEDWEKDAYWHFWLGDEHFRIPKPFEIGVLAGTMPERMWNTFIAGNQENDKMWWSVKHNILGTFSFNPIPQVALPIIENVANRSFFFDRPIENMSDLGQLPFNRFDSRTSDTMRVLGSWLGASPKQLEHLTQGYLGTLGSYVMFLSDAVVRWAEGAPSKPDWTAGDIPVLKSFFRGSGPARNTVYATDLFDAFKEVEMIHRTITDMRKEGRMEDAQALQARSTEKLRFRPQILSAKKRLDEIRRQIDIISGSSLSSTMKRQRIDRLTIEKNRLSERVANQIAPAF